jgi:hypothetical protein
VSSVPVSSVAVGAQGQPVEGGLDVLFRGVEVYEVRPRGMPAVRKTLAFAGLGILALASVSAWALGMRGTGAMTGLQFQQAMAVSAVTLVYGVWAIRRAGVTWRFDHKRKTITRRHWLRGMSRQWKATGVAGVGLVKRQSRLGTEVLQLGLVDPQGKLVAQLACWEQRQVDEMQVQSVVGEIKKVMWWK